MTSRVGIWALQLLAISLRYQRVCPGSWSTGRICFNFQALNRTGPTYYTLSRFCERSKNSLDRNVSPFEHSAGTEREGGVLRRDGKGLLLCFSCLPSGCMSMPGCHTYLLIVLWFLRAVWRGREAYLTGPCCDQGLHISNALVL